MRHLAYFIGVMTMAATLPAQAVPLLDTINGTAASANNPARIVLPGSATGPTNFGGPLGIQFTPPHTAQGSSVTPRLADSMPGDGGSVMIYLVNDNGSNAPTTECDSTLRGTC